MYFASSFSSSGSVHKKTSKPSSKSEKLASKKENKKSPGKAQKSIAKLPTKPSIKPTPPKSLVLDTITSSSSNVASGIASNATLVQPNSIVMQSPKSQTPRTPVKTPTKSPSLSRTASTSVIMSAKKTRTLKQIRDQLKRKFLTTEQRIRLEGEMKRKLDEKKEEKKKVSGNKSITPAITRL